ncbi:hypothetical protein PLESTB_000671200 [Pleodorina starrii]|uniref:Uncharacterized protein n=1 Tax=Pleodorina starrii TaxID=330485 RepID=A0A9W6BIF9_9CHLO|nr:hypothetical protein PLESTB_000671200 [Pleodorina starrii]
MSKKNDCRYLGGVDSQGLCRLGCSAHSHTPTDEYLQAYLSSAGLDKSILSALLKETVLSARKGSDYTLLHQLNATKDFPKAELRVNLQHLLAQSAVLSELGLFNNNDAIYSGIALDAWHVRRVLEGFAGAGASDQRVAEYRSRLMDGPKGLVAKTKATIENSLPVLRLIRCRQRHGVLHQHGIPVSSAAAAQPPDATGFAAAGFADSEEQQLRSARLLGALGAGSKLLADRYPLQNLLACAAHAADCTVQALEAALADIRKSDCFDDTTHLYTFWEGWVPDDRKELAARVNKSTQLKDGRKDMQAVITEAGFRDLELVAVCTGVSMSGGSTFTAYVYRRLLPV